MLVAAATSACSPSLPAIARAAITNGADDDADPGVVALLQGSTLVCTATLIAPRLLLTAAHCVSGDAMPDAYFGSVPGDGGPRVAIAAVRRHPAFDAATLHDDVAMALLAEAAPAGATPWPTPATPIAAGASLRLVGFGRTAAGDTSAPRKRAGTTTVATVSADELTFAPSPSQTCEGDSGGPAFATLEGVEAIVGVTSSGDAACTTLARDMRVDVFADTFVAPWVAATADGAAGAGDRCWYAENCAAGAGECAAALDDATLSFCAPPCDGGCPGGLACLADSDGRRLCRHSPPSPGAAGARCGDDGDCNGTHCVARTSGEPTVCAQSCFTDLPGFCGGELECAAIAGGNGAAACFAKPRGGCAFAGATDGDAGALVAIAALLIALARRRRAPRLAISQVRQYVTW